MRLVGRRGKIFLRRQFYFGKFKRLGLRRNFFQFKNFFFRRNFFRLKNFFDGLNDFLRKIFVAIECRRTCQQKNSRRQENQSRRKIFAARLLRSQRGLEVVDALKTILRVELRALVQNFFQSPAAIFSEQIFHRHAQRINIAARVGLAAAVLFGRRVSLRAQKFRVGLLAVFENSRRVEVNQPNLSALQNQIRRFNVAVNYFFRVKFFEAVAHLQKNFSRLKLAQKIFPCLKIFAVNKFFDDDSFFRVLSAIKNFGGKFERKIFYQLVRQARRRHALYHDEFAALPCSGKPNFAALRTLEQF